MLQGSLGLLALAGLSGLAACASPAPRSASPRPPGLHPLAGGVARERLAVGGVANLPAVVAGMRAFGADLYRGTATVAANWTVSPLSIEVAFGMLRAGCRGSSAREVDSVFGFSPGSAPEGSPHAALNALTAHLVTTGPVGTAPHPPPPGTLAPAPIIAVANGLFVDTAFTAEVNHAFLHVLGSQYGASPTAVSFADPAAAVAINAWVARQTRDRIKKLFDHLDPSTVMVLANAVYLKAAWLNQFSEAASTNGAFTTPTGHRVGARLMRQQVESVPYAAGAGWQRVSLPYVGNELTMRVVVPTGHAADVASLAPALAAATEPALRDRPAMIDLTLPRWDTATNLPLLSALSKLGMADVFGPKADLTGIAPGLHVSDAIHRANITVDERGTEAAAVTGIAIDTSISAQPPIVVRADRPFAWAVVHEPTGAPVFIGHVTNPAVSR